MKHRKPRRTIIPAFVENPFVSEAQRRACYAAHDPNWDCGEWEAHTPKGKKLPKRVTSNKLRLTINKGKGNRNSARNPLKLDPTRTLTLRRFFLQELRKRFARIKGMVVKLLMDEDVFGLKSSDTLLDHFTTPIATTNTRWQFHSDPAKIRAFQSWLQQQMKDNLTSQSERELWDKYIQQGYAKGAGRSFDDVNKARQASSIGDQSKLDFYRGTKEEFLRSSFAQPVSIEKVQLLAQRTFDELENVTDDMSNRMSRELTDGLTEGKSPHDIAKDINEQVDISRERAETIARTEIIRAHAEGQLTALEQMGVEEVGVAVEFTTTDDSLLCPRCAALQGIVLKIDEARGLIPVHPNCRCAFLPANVGEDDEEQKDSKKEIDSAAAEADVDLDIDVERPESILNFNPDQPRDERGRFTSGGESLNEHEYVAQKSADKTSELFGLPKKEVKFHRIEGEKAYGEHGESAASLTNIHTGQSINRQLNMYKHLDRTITEGEHLAAHETVHQAFSADSDLGHQMMEKLDKVNAEFGHSVSMYGAMAGSFENLIELGAVYSHSPEALKKYSPEMHDIAHEWATKLKSQQTENAFCPGSNTDSSCSPHTTDSLSRTPIAKLRDIAKQHGVDHTGDRNAVIPRILAKQGSGTTTGIHPIVPGVAKESSSTIPSTTFDRAHAASQITKTADRLKDEHYNLIHLGELRKEHSNLSKEQFDQALHHARVTGKLSLTPAEGRHGVSEHDKESAIYEHDPVTGRQDRMMLYASVRNALYETDTENVFCPTGEGGGVDPTCSPSESHQHIHSVIEAAEKKAGKEMPKLREALKHMPEKAKGHLAEGLKQIVVINNADPDQRYKDWKQDVIDHEIDQDLSPNTAHAFYTHETKAALVRPLPKSMIQKGGAQDTEEMVWHEMGHALDFSPEGTAFSWHKDWQTAWQKEIGSKKGGKISEYASASPEEGFAEMHRLLCQYRGQGKKGETALKKVEKEHPLCVKYWKDNGLW